MILFKLWVDNSLKYLLLPAYKKKIAEFSFLSFFDSSNIVSCDMGVVFLIDMNFYIITNSNLILIYCMQVELAEKYQADKFGEEKTILVKQVDTLTERLNKATKDLQETQVENGKLLSQLRHTLGRYTGYTDYFLNLDIL